ncbi:MAG TPA: hypothetical protein VGJ32_15485 [Solirubrobacteraceae bacterium]
MRLLVGLLCALALPAAALAVDPTAPTATTGAAKEVKQTSATLTATVDPNGGPTTVRFEYGTSSSYGLSSPEKSVDGADPVTVEIGVTALTEATTYHYRVVATNAAGEARGGDRSFKTASAPVQPTAPAVTTGGARDITSSSATLLGRVDPNGAATRYHFEYGTTSRLGSRTPDQDAGKGTSSSAVSAPVTGLAADDRVSYRIVATNAAGTRRGAIRSFVTDRALRSASISLSASRVTYGDGVVIKGKLAGTGVSRVPVVLEYQPHPFSAPFRQVGLPVGTRRDGSYRFTIDPVLITARLRVVSRTRAPVESPIAVVHSAARVGLIAERRPGRRVRFRGTVRPVAPNGTASLQRRTPAGAWVTVRRVRLRRDGARSRYAMTVRARRDGGVYRVLAAPRDGGAHARGISRERAVTPLRAGTAGR